MKTAYPEESLPIEKLASIAYDAYVLECGGVLSGSKGKFPAWEKVGEFGKTCWKAAARAVLWAHHEAGSQLPGRYSISCVGIIPDPSGGQNHAVVHTHLIIDADNEEVAMSAAQMVAKESYPTALIGSCRAISIPK